MGMLRGVVAVAILAGAIGTAAAAGPVPRRVGQCTESAIRAIGTRLIGAPDSGSAARLADGIPSVSYDRQPAIETARVGDRVTVCLVSIPTGCPRGDHRGRFYKVTVHRPGRSWTLPDAEHLCGGA